MDKIPALDIHFHTSYQGIEYDESVLNIHFRMSYIFISSQCHGLQGLLTSHMLMGVSSLQNQNM